MQLQAFYDSTVFAASYIAHKIGLHVFVLKSWKSPVSICQPTVVVNAAE